MSRGCICLALLLAVATGSWADALPEYESENSATSVRPPLETATDAELIGDVTRDELRNLETISAVEIARLIEREGETLRVHGVVHSTHIPERGRPVILNLGADHRTCFKIVIFGGQFDNWKRDATEIAALYTDADLLIEGTISMYADLPQMKVLAPSQVRRVVDE